MTQEARGALELAGSAQGLALTSVDGPQVLVPLGSGSACGDGGGLTVPSSIPMQR